MERDTNEEGLRCDADNGDGNGNVWLSRIVLEWSSCTDRPPANPDANPGANAPRPATDFNLALRTPGGQSYWMSTSFDDTSESFEFCHTEEGGYDIMILPTVEDFGCPRPSDGKKGERLYLVEERVRVDESKDCPVLTNYAYGL